MKNLTVYLMFEDQCLEAMNFYKSCFNGRITNLQTFGEAPVPFPEEFSHRIFNAHFEAEMVKFRASDSLPQNDVSPGKNFSMFVEFTEKEELITILEKLSDGGKVMMPLSNSPNDNFAMLEDKYQIRWMLNYLVEV